MGSEFLKNLSGVHLNDEQMENIPRATTELCIHVTCKTIEVFGLLGTCFVGPIGAVIKKETRNWPGVKNKMTKAGRGGLILGLFSGQLVMYMAIRKDADNYQVWDRCYRLRHNKNQIRFDQNSFIGTICGAGICAATGSRVMFGGLLGMSSGILFTAVYNYGGVIKNRFKSPDSH